MTEFRTNARCALWKGGVAFASLGVSVANAQTAATAGSEATVAQEQFICRLPGASDRLIGIYRAPDGLQRCRVDYTRDGKTRSLWKAGHDYRYCVRQALRIVGLLEQVRFKCTPQTRDNRSSAPSG